MPRNFMENFYGPKGTQRALVALGGVPRRGQPTRGAPQTASLLYKYPNIPETLGESVGVKTDGSRVGGPELCV